MKVGLTRRIRTLVIAGLLTVGLGLATIRICADGGAMAGAYRTCLAASEEFAVYSSTS